MTVASAPSTLALCSDGTGETGGTPHGTAHRWDVCFALEITPRRWEAMRDPSTWSPQRREVFGRLGEQVQATGLGYGLLMFAPQDQPLAGDLFRVRLYSRAAGAFAEYQRRDYQLDDPGLWRLMEAAILGTGTAAMEDGQTPTPAGRDWHVCTHGRVDAACGKFGIPLQAALAEQAGNGERVWRTSHFGGHRFSPTVQELPAGRTWAHMTPALVTQLMARTGDHLPLAARLRGSSAFDRWAQVAEAHALARLGWWWLDAPKLLTTVQLQQDAAGDQATVKLEFVQPDGTPGQLTAHIRVTHTLEVRGSSHKPATNPAPQYAVTFEEQLA
ncbi:MAG: sucrase ferredoxin [Deinococcus sp.]|nr:sucrase ferredoxin [Deinococcus sp.]